MKIIILFLAFIIMLIACSDNNAKPETSTTQTHQATVETTIEPTIEPTVDNKEEITKMDIEYALSIKIGDTEYTAQFSDNSSVDALIELLKQGPIELEMHDYSNFEKVGDIGHELPQNNESITTEAGDIILYQGRNLVLYYDTNSWNFTSIGKIPDVTTAELLKVLGTGDVRVIFSLKEIN